MSYLTGNISDRMTVLPPDWEKRCKEDEDRMEGFRFPRSAYKGIILEAPIN